MNCFFFLKCKVLYSCNGFSILNVIIIFHAGIPSYNCAVNRQDIQASRAYSEEPDPPAPLPFLLLANELMVQHSLGFPENIADAMSLYATLVALIEDY